MNQQWVGNLGSVCLLGALLAWQAGCGSSTAGGAGDERAPAYSNPMGSAAGGGSSAAPTIGNSSAAGASNGSLTVGAGAEVDPNQPPATETDALPTNGFVVTAHDPQSTFAADVDTASYDLFRRDINLGKLPDAASVRLEEYVNDFKYAYSPPASKLSITLTILALSLTGVGGSATPVFPA